MPFCTQPTPERPYLKKDVLKHSSIPERALEKAMIQLRLRSPFTEQEVYSLLVRAHYLYGAFLHRILKVG